jgi:tRNA (guanine-N7-)-methyltransferase
VRRLYGRRRGYRLRFGQSKLVDELLPQISIPSGDAALGAQTIFGEPKEIWIEVGFGGGEHLVWQAETHPDIGFIGCEPFINGVAKALVQIESKGLTNIRLVMGDARDVLDRLVPNSVSRLFLLFPDPWPKKRHHKRRFICWETLDQLSRVLEPGALIYFATDSPDYCRWTLGHFLARGDFNWLAECADDWRYRTDDGPETRYESKAKRAGRSCVYLTFSRVLGD